MFSYNLQQLKETPLFLVRFKLGDTDESSFHLHDEEIDAMLVLADNNIDKAAIDCCETIIAKLANEVDYSIGPEKVSASQAFNNYTKLLTRLKASTKKYGSPSTSIRPPSFNIGMHDHA